MKFISQTMKKNRFSLPSFAILICLICLIITTIFVLSGCESSNKADNSQINGRSADYSSYTFWPQFPDEPRIQYVVSYQHNSDITPIDKSNLNKIIIGKDIDKDEELINKPYGVDIANGKIYVCDIKESRIVILDPAKQETRIMGISGSNRVVKPVDIAIADDGYIYVADVDRSMVFAFDENERFKAMFSHKDFDPIGLAVYQDKLYVIDNKAQCVKILDRFTGELLKSFGGKGEEDGKFVKPNGIAIDKQGNIYVTDVIKCRVQKFNADGDLISAFGIISDQIGTFSRPKHVATDSDGNVYVVDAGFANVQIFNKDGQLLTFFGAAGVHPGAMYLPVGISVYEGDLSPFQKYIHPDFVADRIIVVTNQLGLSKVALYAMGQLKNGITVADLAPTRIDVKKGLSNEDERSDVLKRMQANPNEQPEELDNKTDNK